LGSIIRSGVEIFFGFTTLFALGPFSTRFMNIKFIKLEDVVSGEGISSIPLPVMVLNLINQILGAFVTFVLITILVKKRKMITMTGHISTK